MRIEKLEINGFGRFNNITLDLIPGMNVIYGSNESGKSTLSSFIKAMLYFSASQKNSKTVIDNYKKYKPWTGTVFSGNMEYCLDNGEKFRIERNFELNFVKVYDSFFNDITATFDLNKSKNLSFAQKHIGLNETCFEKTVYIRQMASSIDEYGMKELHTRLLNIYQTGSEDHSFRIAENALLDALKKHVGTDKTSIRPMDKVNSRLKELRSELVTLMKKREFTIGLERELHTSIKYLDIIHKKSEAIRIATSVLNIKKELEKQDVYKSQVLEIISILEDNSNELLLIENKLQTLKTSNSIYHGLFNLSNDDIEETVLQYKKFTDLEIESNRLQKVIEEKKASLSEEEIILSSLSAFNYLEKGTDIEMLELNKKVDYLKKQINNIIEEHSLDEGKTSKSLLNKVLIGLSISLTLVIIVFGLTFNPLLFLGLIPAFGFLGFTAMLRAFGKKHSSELKNLTTQSENHKLLVNEVNELEKRIDELLTNSKASSIDEFFNMYSLYNSKVLVFTELNDNICLMEEKLTLNQNKLSAAKNYITKKLILAGIELDSTNKIEEIHIDAMQKELSRRLTYGANLEYMLKRKADIQNNYQKTFSKADSLFGEYKFSDVESLKSYIREIESSIKDLITSYEKCTKDFMDFCSTYKITIETKIDSKNFEIKDFFNKSSEQIEGFIEEIKKENINAENNLKIRIKELEVLIENSVGNDSIQNVEEEITSLENKKKELESMDFSIKTALATLSEASIEIQRDYIPLLNRNAGYYLSKISGKKYDKMLVDENFNIKVFSPDLNQVIPGKLLSNGTVDQIYFALRLAASDMLTNYGESLPLIMDEVLCQYDLQRTIETIKLLWELSDHRQIILFTCKDREVEVIKNICNINTISIVELD